MADEIPDPDERPVTLAELATWMNAPAYADEVKLNESLDAALEWVTDKVGPIESVARDYVVHPSGHSLVLPDTHLVEVSEVVDPGGAPVAVPAAQVNLLAGVIEVTRRGRIAYGPWTVTATTREHGASVRLAVKIIASHLFEVHRGRAGNDAARGMLANATPTGDSDGVPKGFAIPARAVQLLEPFRRPGAVGA